MGESVELMKGWNARVYPKEVQEAIERDKPRNPVRPKGYSNIECPACGAHMKQFYEPEEANVPFCYNCGQRLDWDATVTVKLPKHFGDLSDV